MARPTISRQLARSTVVGSAGFDTNAPAPLIVNNELPSGNQAVAVLNVRTDGAIVSTGSPTNVRVADGEKKILRSLTLETDKHGQIINNMEGLLLHRMLTYEYGTPPDFGQVSSTPANADTFFANWALPLILPNGYRPFDTILDVMTARPKLTTQYGPRSDIFSTSGGSSPVTQVQNMTQSVEAKILPGPLNVGIDDTGKANASYSELPKLMRYLEMSIIPITATQTRLQIPLPFADRIWRRLFITQRDGSTRGEISNIIAGTAQVSLVVNNTEIVSRRTFQDIVSLNKQEYAVQSLPAGVAVIDFDSDMQERINDLLSTLTRESGNMFLFIDVTTQSNGQLWLGFDTLKELPAAAVRS